MNGIRINSNALLAYLCRKSESLEFIEGKHLKEHLIPLLHSTSFMPKITLTNADNIKEDLNNSELENARKSTYATVSKIKEESVNSSSELDTVEENRNAIIKVHINMSYTSRSMGMALIRYLVYFREDLYYSYLTMIDYGFAFSFDVSYIPTCLSLYLLLRGGWRCARFGGCF